MSSIDVRSRITNAQKHIWQSIEGNSSNLLHLKASLSKVIQLNSVDDLKHFAEATALAEKEKWDMSTQTISPPKWTSFV